MHDFQDLQAKLEPPRDLDALRIRIQEEVEIPHQKRERELEREIAKFRKLYFEAKREKEVSESRREQNETDRKIEVAVSQSSQTKLINTLRKQIDVLRAKLVQSDYKEDQDVSSLRAKVTELKIRNEQLESEILSCRKDKNEVVVRLEEEKLRHVHESASWETKTNRALSDAKEFERKNLRLLERLEKANSTLEKTRNTLNEKDRLLKKQEQQRDSERETHRKTVTNFEIEMSTLQSKAESERLESCRRVESLKRTLEETTRLKEQELEDMRRREKILIQERDEARKELNSHNVETRRERTLLRSEVESLSRELESVHNNFNARRDKFEEQLSSCRQERDDAVKQKLNAESRLKHLEQKLKLNSERASDAIVQKQRFEEKLRTLRSRMQNLAKRNEELSLSEKKLRLEASAAITEKSNSMENLRHVYKQFNMEKEEEHAKHYSDLESEVKMLRTQDEKMRGVMRTILGRAKERVLATEKKAHKINRKFQKMKQKLSRERSEFETYRKSQEANVEKLWNRIKVLEEKEEMM